MSENQLRVLTLNCWGLKFVAKNLRARIEGIAAKLSQVDHDIICVQELWIYTDYEKVRDSVSQRLPHSKFFYSGALGAGLAIFSRFPIIASELLPYALNGTPMDVAAGDWFVGKACSSITISHPVLGQVQIFNTHLYAKGGETGPEHVRAHRLINAWEFAKQANQSAALGRYVIAAGDFNSIPSTLPITIIKDHASLTDAWVASHPPLAANATASTPAEAISKFGTTADSPLNTYSAGKPLDPYARKFWGKRLDYIFYRQPVRPLDDRIHTLKCVQSKVVFTETVPGEAFSYSDHFGLEATFEFPLEGGPVENTSTSGSLAANDITTFIQALTARYRFSRERGRRELIIFGLCIILLVGFIVASAWLPGGRNISSWLNPIFTLLTVFIAWLATTMLYEGFIYGNWELNALMNVIEELEIHKKGLEGGQTPGRYTDSEQSHR